MTVAEAAEDFGGVAVPIATVRDYIYKGFRGVKLESIFINRRYTSKEAIQRFIAWKQDVEREQNDIKLFAGQRDKEVQKVLASKPLDESQLTAKQRADCYEMIRMYKAMYPDEPA